MHAKKNTKLQMIKKNKFDYRREMFIRILVNMRECEKI